MPVFPGKQFLQIALPDDEQERAQFYKRIVLTTFFWLFVFPLFWLPRPIDDDSTEVKGEKRKQKAPQVKDTPARAASSIPMLFYSSLGLVLSVIAIVHYSSNNSFTNR